MNIKKTEQIIRITVSSYDPALVEVAINKIMDVTNRTGAITSGPVPLPRKIKRWTVPRSSFVHKRSQEAFEMRISTRIVDIKESNNKTIEALRNLDLSSGIHTNVQILEK